MVDPTIKTLILSFRAIGVIFGIYGIFWICKQYRRGTILKNSTGLILAAIAVADSFNISYSIYRFFRTVLKFDDIFDDYILNLLSAIFESIFDWSVVSSSHLLLQLSGQLVYVLCGGFNTKLWKARYFIAAFGLIGPVFYYTLPIAFYNSTEFNKQELNDDYISDFVTFLFIPSALSKRIVFFLVASMLLVAVLLYLFLWRNMQRLVYRFSSRGSSNSDTLLVRLVMIYSLSIVVGWAPWILRTLVIRIIQKKSDSDFNSSFSIETLLILVMNLFDPARGYIHAMAIYFVYRTRNNINFRTKGVAYVLKTVFLMDELVDSNETVNISSENLSNDKTAMKPSWDLDDIEQVEYSHSLNTSRNFSKLSPL